MSAFGGKRTLVPYSAMSAFDPKRTSATEFAVMHNRSGGVVGFKRRLEGNK